MLLRLSALLSLSWLAACPATDADPAVDTEPDVNDSPSDTEPPAPQEPAVLSSSGPRACLQPLNPGEPYFTQRTTDAIPADVPFVVGGGIAIAELNGDGVLDAVIVNQRTAHLAHPLMQQAARGEVVLTIEEEHERRGLFGASAADYDGDGDFDLMITRYHGPNHLLQNDGTGQFTDVTNEAGVAGPPLHWSASSAWADIDLDGDLDLVVSGYGFVEEDAEITSDLFDPADPTLLYENQGDGTFRDISDRIAPELQGAYTFLAGFHDIDDDGYPDLYFANDFAGKRELSQPLFQRDGRFVVDPAFASLASNVIGMGLGVGDLNGDGRLDFLLPGWNELGVLVSQPNGWFDMAQVLGLQPDSRRKQMIAWGSEIVDLNNDALLDVFVSYGFLGSRATNNDRRQPDSMFMQTGPMQFEDRGERFDIDQPGSTRSVVFADLDDDGWLDVSKTFLDADAMMLMAHCGDKAWMRMELRQPGMNRYAIGARVRVTTGGLTQSRTILAGGTGYGSSGPPRAHFGLGEATKADQVEVRWPDGRVDLLTDVPVRELLTVTRPL